MQFYLLNIRSKLHYLKCKNYTSHCSELSQLHQQPVDAVLHPTFIWKLCYKLQSVVTFTFIQQIQNVVFFTERHHFDRQCDVIFKIHIIFGVRFERWKVDEKQTYMKTEIYKLYSVVFWIFLPNVIKIDPYNFKLYRFIAGTCIKADVEISLHTQMLCVCEII